MLTTADLFILNLLATFAPYLIVAVSINLEYGYAGVPNFGKVLAVAGGAFMAGVIPGRILASTLGIGKGMDFIKSNVPIITQINGVISSNAISSLQIFIITLIIAAIVGALLGLAVAYPVARLRSDYLGMTFLAAGQVILVIGNNYSPLVGGTQGVNVPDPFQWASSFGINRDILAVIIMMIIAVVIFLYARRLTHSPLGRMLRAVRDDENSVLALGKDVQKTRINIIIIASALAAIAGALYAFYTANVFYASFSRASWTFWPWVMVILGGAANDWGVVAGTFIFVAVRQTITFFSSDLAPFIPFNPVWLDTLLLGLALLLILIYRPEGLIPEKPIKTIKDGRPPGEVAEEDAKSEPGGGKAMDKAQSLASRLKDLFTEKKKDEPTKESS
ncbi:MAG TPA: branched-chain amino acid ABC transporter permease [Candidatus Nanoarchaeia archaeon]|nr:branched-chain amino acid ABC transporter permease [Candidatus Nanoarchaeia archaeon]